MPVTQSIACLKTIHWETVIELAWKTENCADPGFFQRRVGGGGGGVSIYALIISRSYTLVSTSLMICAVHVVKYRKIPKINPGACIFPRGGGHLGIFWVGMCRPGLQIGTPFKKNFP